MAGEENETLDVQLPENGGGIELEAQILSEQHPGNSNYTLSEILYGFGVSFPVACLGGALGFALEVLIELLIHLETESDEEAQSLISDAAIGVAASSGAVCASIAGFFAVRHAHQKQSGGFCQGLCDTLSCLCNALRTYD